jgi:hypothetical protein
MAKQELEVEVRRRGRSADEFTVDADPANVGELRDVLRGWLEGNKWHPQLWDQFDLLVRLAGESKIQRTVRP